ncbi:permease [Planococcus sp. CAU13]|uniref:permease n=1 Tax=Planococcus sp. CAU13 TaxID=1541197 RepID=UPI001F48E04F|nr:permease [Planococcus sp. CAU13]
MSMRNSWPAFNWLWLVPVIGLYAWSIRQSLIAISEIEESSSNFWDLLLHGSNDVYLINYLMFPLFLFRIGYQLTSFYEYTLLIRFGSYAKWIVRQALDFSLFTVSLLLLWNAAILSLAIGLPFSMEWSEISRLDRDGNEILFTLSSFFSSPLLAWAGQFLLFFLTLTTIHLLAALIYVVSKSRWLLNSFLTLMFILAVLSFKVFPPSLKWISLPNYLSLFHGIASFGHIIIPFGVLCTLLLMCIGSLWLIGRDYPLFRTQLKEKWPILAFSGFILFALVMKAVQFRGQQLTLSDYWIVSFLGTTQESFDMLSFSFYLIVFLGFMYFVQLFLQTQLKELNYTSIIRHRSMLKWLFGWLTKLFGLILLFLALLMVSALMTGLAFDYPLIGNSVLFPDIPYPPILYHFWVNGVLQMVFYILLVILVSLLTEDVMKSFAVLLGMSIFMFPGVNFNYFFPFGLNSMGLLLETTPLLQHSAVLLIYTLGLSAALVYLLRKKDFNF